MAKKQKRFSPLKPGTKIQYQNIELLKDFLTVRGTIIPRRNTRLLVKQQRELVKAVKRARIMGLLPFSIAKSK
uniref:Ribosomal protein S18 n=1 Tax=Olisthodiscus luteus TaxID=83000 RepID=A0A7U0KSP9_OLILU|nr:ribosomal protein S18 [Olisthodiscus luteus]QQW50552.1 ribosomal protein S18 [Olisthodiscus luteus]